MERKTITNMTRCLLVMFLVGICGRGYGLYSQILKSKPDAWMDIVTGTASAPEQYRIGVVLSGHWISQHLGWHGHMLGLGVVFWIFDVTSSCFAALVLYQLLIRTAAFERASVAVQCFGSAAFAALMFYLVDWLIWYQRVSTLPTSAIVALMLWLWTPRKDGAARGSVQAAIAMCFLLLVLAQSFIRADVALMVCVGVFVAAATGLGGTLSLRRGVAMASAAAGGLMAVAVQIYLVKVRYPQATYGDVPVVMLIHEWQHPANAVTPMIFLTPFLWTVREASRQRWGGDGAGAAFLIAAGAYACLWLVFGRLDEVRIFLPMAMAVTPLTVELAMRRLEAPQIGPE